NHGADLKVADRAGRTAFDYAIIRGDRETAKLLVTRGADVDARGKYALTPLMRAAERGDTTAMEVALELGAKINAQSEAMLAAMDGKADAVRLLLRYGADRELKDYRGKSAIDWARESGRSVIVEMLRGPADRSRR